MAKIPTASELEKQCNRCKAWKLASADNFYARDDSYDGLRGTCKACDYKSNEKYRQTEKGQASRKSWAVKQWQRAKLWPNAFAVVEALVNDRPELAQRLAKQAFLKAKAAGLLEG